MSLGSLMLSEFSKLRVLIAERNWLTKAEGLHGLDKLETLNLNRNNIRVIGRLFMAMLVFHCP